MTVVALALVHFVWQGAALGALAVILDRLANRATTRYAIGVTALAAMVIAPVGTVTVLKLRTAERSPVFLNVSQSPPERDAQDRFNEQAAQAADRRPSSLASSRSRTFATPAPSAVVRLVDSLGHPRAARGIVLAWAIGVLALTLRLTGAWIVTRRLATAAVRPIGDDLAARVRELATRAGLRDAVYCLESASVDTPMVVGWIRPVVLLPAAVLTGLPMPQLEALIAHELAHLRRYDPIVNFLQSITETLLFYHPAVWVVSRGVREAREQCCDDLAIDLVDDRLTYVTALAELAARSASRSAALAANGGSLALRIGRLLGQPQARSWAPIVGALMVLVVTAVVALTPIAAASTSARSVTPTAPVRPLEVPRVGLGEERPGLPLATAISRAMPTAEMALPAQAESPNLEVASVAGRVVNAAGNGVLEVHVLLLGRVVIDKHDYLVPIHWGERMATLDGMSETTATGAFSFPAVQPGTYFLVALPEPFARDAWRYMFPPAEGPTGYRPTYYPSGERDADARPIEVRAGQALEGLTITVPRVETGSILVEAIPAAPGNPQQSQYIMTDAYSAPNGELQKALRMQRRGTGSLLFEHVPVGQYILSIDSQRRVIVRADQTTTVTVLRRPSPMLRAKVTVDGSGAPPPTRDVAVRFDPTDDVQAVMYTALHAPVHLSDQGEFQLFEWMPAILRVDPPAGWTLKRVMLNGRDITNLPIDFTQAPEGLEIVLAAAQ